MLRVSVRHKDSEQKTMKLHSSTLHTSFHVSMSKSYLCTKLRLAPLHVTSIAIALSIVQNNVIIVMMVVYLEGWKHNYGQVCWYLIT